MATLGVRISFSDLVRDCIARAHRPATDTPLMNCIAYANATIKNIASTGEYKADLAEAVLTADAIPYVYVKPRNYRQTLAVSYPQASGADPIYPEPLQPGKVLLDQNFYYYYSGNTIVFNGVAVGSSVNVAYYTHPKRFVYYPVGEEPAYYDEETESWVYATAYDVDDDTREAARDLVSHWVIERWYDLLAEGTLTKLYNHLGDDRSRATFANYKDLLQDVPKGEILGFTEWQQHQPR
jgi:hypothetical protein